ncbi:hypothetical protein FXO38_16070 [Capsicum annuum]|nr:hypothetical protein FXO38_16070 [Capsicum annuum]
MHTKFQMDYRSSVVRKSLDQLPVSKRITTRQSSSLTRFQGSTGPEGSIVCNLTCISARGYLHSLHFCKRLLPRLGPLNSWSHGGNFTNYAKAPLLIKNPVLRDKIYVARVLPKFAPHIGCHTVNDIEDRIKAMLTKNQFKKFCIDSIFGVFMKKKNCVVQAQLGRCIMSLETTESSTSDIVIRAKGTTLHFSLREFVVVTDLNCHSNRDDFGFDEDNDEDAFKFANLYFIHEFFLSSIDTVIIPRLHFDLVESDRYRDYPWGLVAYEELAKSLNKKLKPTGKFYMLYGMPLDIQIWLYECCSAVPRTVASKVDSQIPRLLNWKTNVIRLRYESLMESLFNDSNDKDSPLKHQLSISRKKNQGDSSNSPVKKKLKNQSKGVDQRTPKRTHPSRVVKMSSVKTPIFKVIKSKETVPSNRKDIPIQSPDMSFFNREDGDDVLSKKVF